MQLMRLPAVIAITSACLSAASAGAQAWASPDSVIATEHARREALLAADTVRLGRMVAAEFTEISRLGTVRTRADNIGEVATGALHLTMIRQDSLTVHVYGTTAVLIGISENGGTFRGTPFTGRVRYMRVFVHRDGRWQAVAMEQTPTP
ncbi:MAG TPA: nuclear transport factor 2 family protein [Gemmatimonadaceae bacterium]|nr:nuclear transport factor 2 family protein [Gemmatimonadaceae bacterium]